MRMAAEAIFSRLCSIVERTTFCLTNHTYTLEMLFEFRINNTDLNRLNLVFTDLEARGDGDWMLATKFVDRLEITHGLGGQGEIRLFKDRNYRLFTGPPRPVQADWELSQIRKPSERTLRLFAERVNRYCDPTRLPQFLQKPDKLVDMTDSGAAESLIALSGQNEPLGGAVLDLRFPGRTRLFGPYSFQQNSELQTSLLKAALEKAEKLRINTLVAEDLSEENETLFHAHLGNKELTLPEAGCLTLKYFLRSAPKEESFVVWLAGDLKPFLEGEYRRLGWHRDLQVWQPGFRPVRGPSVLACEFHRETSEVTLKPILAGDNVIENLQKHLECFRDEGFLNFFFELDLGDARQMRFVEALKETNFEPCCLIPSAGRGDLLLLRQHEQPSDWL